MSSISLSSIIKTSSYRFKWVGLRWQLILTLIVLWSVSKWLRSEYGQDDSNQWLVMNLFLQLTKWTLIGFFTISFLSAFITWAYFVNGVKNNRLTFQAKFGDGQKALRQATKLDQTQPFRPKLNQVGTARTQLPCHLVGRPIVKITGINKCIELTVGDGLHRSWGDASNRGAG